MKNKSLIELRELDLTILNWLKTKLKVSSIARGVFPKAKNPLQSLNTYLIKYLRLGLIERQSIGVYNITNTGKYFIKILTKLRNETFIY